MMPLSITTSLSRSPCLNNPASSPNSGSNSAPVRRFHTKPESGLRPRRFIAVEWHPGELYRRVDFIVTMSRPTKRVVALLGREPYEPRPERDE
jgi:hypothetical protein